MQPLDLRGRKFGRLTAIERAAPNASSTRWHCICECGTKRIVGTSNLTHGSVQSCGCLAREKSSIRATTHGKSKTSEYHIWNSMFVRCEDPTHKSYSFYGGRGISVCQRWQSFETFFADMGPRPSPSHSIDRFPNKDGNYEPGNCRWATIKEQNNNRRSARMVTYHGKTQTLLDAVTSGSGKYDTVIARLKLGWDTDAAIDTPIRAKRPNRTGPRYVREVESAK